MSNAKVQKPTVITKKDRGSEKVKTDDGLFLGVSAKLAELIEVKESELEKLRRKGIGMDKERGG